MKKRVIVDDLSCYAKNDAPYRESYSIGKGKDERHYELHNNDVGVAYYDGDIFFLVAYDRKWVIESMIAKDKSTSMTLVLARITKYLVEHGLY